MSRPGSAGPSAVGWRRSGDRRVFFFHAERHEELWLGHRGRPNEVLLRDPREEIIVAHRARLIEPLVAAVEIGHGVLEGKAGTDGALRIVLVGDSAAMTVLGHSSTVPATTLLHKPESSLVQ